jgi:peptidoglycan hydrolase-like protein with peptidoglycan-binding domain
VTANISVCENPEPVAEMRRIYDAVSQTLGYRTLQQFSGGDVWQLKVMLQALGFYKSGETPLDARAPGANVFTPDVVTAVDAFRASEKLGGPGVGSPSGLVDAETVAHLWAALERAGKAQTVRQQLLDITQVRR